MRSLIDCWDRAPKKEDGKQPQLALHASSKPTPQLKHPRTDRFFYSVLQKSGAKPQAFGERYRFADANQNNNLY
jgi:hypothetical protein